jgi:hypothetical protein
MVPPEGSCPGRKVAYHTGVRIFGRLLCGMVIPRKKEKKRETQRKPERIAAKFPIHGDSSVHMG